MKIGEIAARAHTPVDTVRYYERIGLLPPAARTSANYRSYDAQHLARLDFIRRCRALDMSLDEIRTLLEFCDAPQRDCGDVNTLLDAHIGHVQARLEELQALHGELKQLRRVCRTPGHAGACRILNALRTPPAPRRRATVDAPLARSLHGRRAGG